MALLLQKLHSSKIGILYFKLTELALDKAFPLLLLLIRITIAKVFWFSGLTKITHMSAALYLFEYEYNLPIFSPEIAAYLATATELSMPIFLVLGLFSRLAAIPLLCITAVIEFTYLQLPIHTYWAYMLGVIVLYGPGKLSLDHLFARIVRK